MGTPHPTHMKRRRISTEIDPFLPELHGALNTPTSSKHLSPLLHNMLGSGATTKEDYLQRLDTTIAQLRQSAVAQLGSEGDEHNPDLTTFDDEAAQIRTAVVSVLRLNSVAA